MYFILKSMEVGPSFRIANPKYPTKDPNYRIIAPQKSRYTHIDFYIRVEVVGPRVMFERELLRENVRFRKDDNAFLAVADPEALQAAADRLTAGIIRKRLLNIAEGAGKFSPAEKAVFYKRARASATESAAVLDSFPASPPAVDRDRILLRHKSTNQQKEALCARRSMSRPRSVSFSPFPSSPSTITRR